MEHINGVLFSNNNFELLFNINKLTKRTNVFVTVTNDFEEFFLLIKDIRPAFVIIDIDTVEIPVGIIKTFLNKRVCNISNICSFSLTYNVDIEGVFKLSYNNLYEILNFKYNDVDIESDGCVTPELCDRINIMLLKYGFSTKHLGFLYIKEIIKDVIINNSAMKSFNSMIYPKVARKYSTTVASVERNIRNAISYAYKSNKENIDLFFLKANSPTNREVLFGLLDTLINNTVPKR